MIRLLSGGGEDGGTVIPSWGSGPFLVPATPGVPGPRFLCSVDGEPAVARWNGSQYELLPPSGAAQAFAAANSMPPGSALPLLADFTYIAPGGIFNFGAFDSQVAVNLAFAPADGDCEFTDLDLTFFSTSGTGYQVIRLYVGPVSGSAITENYATGYVTVVGSAVSVPAGTPTDPGEVTFSVSVPGSGTFAIVVELSNGAEASPWTQQFTDTDFSQFLIGREGKLTTLPSSGTFNLTSGALFNQYPNMAIKVRGLSKPWATVLVPGDSHAGDYDAGNFNERRGTTFRLSQLAETDSVPVTFVTLGYDGLRTEQIATRWQNLLAGAFSDARAAILPAFSINNFSTGRTALQAQDDYLAMEQALDPQPSIPGLWGVNNGATAPQWALQRAVWDWHLARRPDALDDHLGFTVDGNTGQWIPPYGSPDGAHETVAGQLLRAERWWPSLKTWLAGLGVEAP